jgi:hypothetical protein
VFEDRFNEIKHKTKFMEYTQKAYNEVLKDFDKEGNTFDEPNIHTAFIAAH